MRKGWQRERSNGVWHHFDGTDAHHADCGIGFVPDTELTDEPPENEKVCTVCRNDICVSRVQSNVGEGPRDGSPGEVFYEDAKRTPVPRAATLVDVLRECTDIVSAEYAEKYLHAIPDAPVVDRVKYLVGKCRGKRVLSLGGSGPADEAIKKAAAKYYSVDRAGAPSFNIDLDKSPKSLAFVAALFDLVVCGEVLEHLSNPGRLLDAVRALGVPVIVTAPNAFSSVGSGWLAKHKENVNAEHVAWYSYRTLLTLVTRHGFTVKDFAWYNGKPIRAEGLIFELE